MNGKRLLSLGMAAALICTSVLCMDVQAKGEFSKESQVLESETEEKSAHEKFTEGLQRTETNSDEYEYKELEDGTLEISKYTGNDSEVVIPSKINGKQVSRIGTYSFIYLTELESVIIPESIRSIGDRAFYQSSNLRNIVLPKSVVSIGEWAFKDTLWLENLKEESPLVVVNDILIDGSSYTETEVMVPDSVKSIAGGAFYGCKFQRVVISESVEEIGVYAFAECRSLEKIVIPKNVTWLGGCAFQNCKSLKHVEILADTINIASIAFSNCTSLKSIVFTDGNIHIGQAAFYGCTDLEEVKLPEGLESIELEVFHGCSSLRELVIPNGVKSISSAFYGCYNLEKIEFPRSVTYIAFDAFFSAEQLSLVVPKGSYAEKYAKEQNLKYTYTDSSECVHDYTSVISKEAGCKEIGTETFTCTKCGDSYEEEIPAKGHKFQTKITKATQKKNGNITKTCVACGKKETTVIHSAKTIKLSKASCTYNGTIQKLSIIVKDSKGKTLKNKRDYTVSVPQNMKNVGNYTISVKLKGNYSGTIERTFTVNPKGTVLAKVTAKKKGFTAKWNKQESQTTGYEIAYSTDKAFKKNVKILPIRKNKTVTTMVEKLKGKKTKKPKPM